MLEIKNLKLNLGQFSLNDINIKIESGEYFVMLGPSGSGKTVLLETIAGLYKPDEGSIHYNNRNLVSLPPEKRNIGFVYQNYELFPHMTVRDNIIFGLKVRKISEDIINEKLHVLVSMLKISHLLHRYPNKLSGGEKQRVALARALIISPEILLLDEPMSALDMTIKLSLQKEIKAIHKELKTTVFHVTHDIEEAVYLSDKIGIMKGGRLLEVLNSNNAYEVREYPFLNEVFKIQKERWTENGLLYRFVE